MNSDNGLALVGKARRMLAEAKSIPEVTEVANIAQLARQAAKKARMGLEAQNEAAEVCLRARRQRARLIRLGQERGEIATRGRPDNCDTVSQLSDLGISRKDSSRDQKILDIPEELFELEIMEAKVSEEELTAARMIRLSEKLKREARAKAKGVPDPIDGKYRVFYADPPWQYSDSGVITDNDAYGRAKRHYPTMSLDEIKEMGEQVKEAAEDDAVLFLWVTSPMLEDAFDVVKAWGFKYKTSFVWDKVRHNFGHYNSVRHELLLVCTRGSCTPDELKLFDSVQSIERSSKHSEKPGEFRQIIDALYTWGNRIELFARAEVDGWETWGNEPQQ